MYISNQLTKDLAQKELKKGKYIKNSELDLFLHDRIGDPIKDKWPLIKMPKTYEQIEAQKRNHAKFLIELDKFNHKILKP